jgi:hypothetical protein
VWAATAAATLIIGIGVGLSLRDYGIPGAVLASDERARPLVGEAKLLMDTRFEEFSNRLGARERAKAMPRSPAAPAATRRPSSPEPTDSEES